MRNGSRLEISTAATLMMSVWASCCDAQQAYELTDLGTLGGVTSTGYGINDSGQIVGSSAIAGDAATHAFLYSQGTIVDLGTLGGATSVAYAINASGQIVGYASVSGGANHATTWINKLPTDLGTNGGGESYARAINGPGEIVGIVGSQSGFCSGTATYWHGATVISLPIDHANNDNSGQALGIDDTGRIVGCVNNATVMHDLPVVWSGTSNLYAALPYLGYGGLGYALNNSGITVGEVDTAAFPQASLWSGTQRITLNPLGTLGTSYFAHAVNSAGVIIGSDSTLDTARAVLWTSGTAQPVDLNSTLRPQAAAANMLTDATAINTSGLIVANGIVTENGAHHAFLLTPVTAVGPPTVTLSADPATVLTGQSYTLSWSSTNSWACTAGGAGPGGAPWSGILATSGSQTLQAGATAGAVTATISCSFGNQSAKTQTAVTVNYPPVTASISASPTSIMSGQSTTLTWSSSNASNCMASGGAVGDGWTGTTRAASGNAVITEPIVVASPLTATFTLTCTSSAGQTGVATTQLVINPPAVPDKGGGGGALDRWFILGLLGVAVLRTGLPASRRWRFGQLPPLSFAPTRR